MKKIFTVYDSKAEAYLTPFFMSTSGEAIRAFSDSVKNRESAINKHPEDYTLFEIGLFDETAAAIVTHDALISLAIALEFVETREEPK